MSKKQSIVALLKTLNIGLRQIDSVRRVQHLAKLQRLVRQFPLNSAQNMAKLQSQLNYRLKFLKISHPNISFEVKEENDKEEEKNTGFEYIFEGSPEVLKENEREQKEQQQQEVTYTVQNGKLIKRVNGVRAEVDFKNWYLGNADPEDLKKHKQMLERQFFQGPIWQNKTKPKPSAVEYLEQAVAALEKGKEAPKYEVQTQDKPAQAKQLTEKQIEERFQTLKR